MVRLREFTRNARQPMCAAEVSGINKVKAAGPKPAALMLTGCISVSCHLAYNGKSGAGRSEEEE